MDVAIPHCDFFGPDQSESLPRPGLLSLRCVAKNGLPVGGFLKYCPHMGTAHEVWDILVRMPAAQIERDLAWAAKHPRKFKFDPLGFLRGPEQCSSEAFARYCHTRMLYAYVLSRRPGVPAELVLFVADNAADYMIHCALDVADEQGRLAQLNRKMGVILDREGLAADRDLQRGQGPPDYLEALEESLEIIERITGTLLPGILRRYGFNSLAELYEQHRATFDIMQEVGRRLRRRDAEPGSDTLEGNQWCAGEILKKHGPAALERLNRRLEALGLPVA